MEVRNRETAELSPAELRAIRDLLDRAFSGDFSDDDWDHALGGWHVVLGDALSPMAHASVVRRRLTVGTREYRAGYVEAVAVAPERQRKGLGTLLMRPIGELIERHFDLGALSTSVWPFYARLGWKRWQGPTWVRAADGHLLRTAEEDESIMVRRRADQEPVDLAAPITCDERAGDSW